MCSIKSCLSLTTWSLSLAIAMRRSLFSPLICLTFSSSFAIFSNFLLRHLDAASLFLALFLSNLIFSWSCMSIGLTAGRLTDCCAPRCCWCWCWWWWLLWWPEEMTSDAEWPEVENVIAWWLTWWTFIGSRTAAVGTGWRREGREAVDWGAIHSSLEEEETESDRIFCNAFSNPRANSFCSAVTSIASGRGVDDGSVETMRGFASCSSKGITLAWEEVCWEGSECPFVGIKADDGISEGVGVIVAASDDRNLAISGVFNLHLSTSVESSARPFDQAWLK